MVKKVLIKQYLEKCGYTLIRSDSDKTTNIGIERWGWLKAFDIHTVFDIGANKGVFTERIIAQIPEVSVYAFEPLANCYEKYKNTFAENPSVHAFNIALSDSIGQSTFYVSKHLASSSLFEMEDSHKMYFPHTSECEIELINTRTLDSFAEDIPISGNLLIKMDVQGSEHKVIKGGENYFSKASVVITEMSHFPLYKEQSLFNDVHTLLHRLGLRYTGTLSQCLRTEDYLPIFSNAIYVRQNLLPFSGNMLP